MNECEQHTHDDYICRCRCRVVFLWRCVFVFSSHLFWTSSSLDVPAGVTQEEGHTGFLRHLPSAVHAFIFLARRIHRPFPSSTVRSNFVSFSTFVGHFYFYFPFFSEEKSQLPGLELTSQRVRRLRGYQLSYRVRLFFVCLFLFRLFVFMKPRPFVQSSFFEMHSPRQPYAIVEFISCFLGEVLLFLVSE